MVNKDEYISFILCYSVTDIQLVRRIFCELVH